MMEKIIDDGRNDEEFLLCCDVISPGLFGAMAQ